MHTKTYPKVILVMAMFLIMAGFAGQAGAATVKQPQYVPSPYTTVPSGSPMGALPLNTIGLDSTNLSIYEVSGRWEVSQTEVQQVLDAISPGRYVALDDVGPGTGKTFLNFQFRYSRVTELLEPTGTLPIGIYGPSSTLFFFVTAQDTAPDAYNLGRTFRGSPDHHVFLNLVQYGDAADLTNQANATTVSTLASIETDSSDADGVLNIHINVRGQDNSIKFTADVSGPGFPSTPFLTGDVLDDTPGFASTTPRDDRPFRFLSDGPGGTHPTILFGNRRGGIHQTSLKATLGGNSGVLTTPGGNITVDDRTASEGIQLLDGGLGVQPSGLRRMAEVVVVRCDQGTGTNTCGLNCNALCP